MLFIVIFGTLSFSSAGVKTHNHDFGHFRLLEHDADGSNRLARYDFLLVFRSDLKYRWNPTVSLYLFMKQLELICNNKITTERYWTTVWTPTVCISVGRMLCALCVGHVWCIHLIVLCTKNSLWPVIILMCFVCLFCVFVGKATQHLSEKVSSLCFQFYKVVQIH